jgi:intron-binding protein aquarius
MQSTPKKPRLDTEGSQTSGPKEVHPTGGDIIARLSREYWVGENTKPFDPQVIEELYSVELQNKRVPRLMALELSLYLEKYVYDSLQLFTPNSYLWPNFDAEKASFAHVISIILLVNEKCRENVDAWCTLKQCA